MNDHSQQPDLFDVNETTRRLYDLLAVICFILAVGVIALFELQ